MSREETLTNLHLMHGLRDNEIAHANADDVICDLLKSHDY